MAYLVVSGYHAYNAERWVQWLNYALFCFAICANAIASLVYWTILLEIDLERPTVKGNYWQIGMNFCAHSVPFFVMVYSAATTEIHMLKRHSWIMPVYGYCIYTPFYLTMSYFLDTEGYPVMNPKQPLEFAAFITAVACASAGIWAAIACLTKWLRKRQSS